MKEGTKARVRLRPGPPVFTSCNPLLGVSVHIIVDTDITYTGPNGFGFQINAYSAAAEFDGAQQYVVLFDPSRAPYLTCVVCNFHSKQEPIINIQQPLQGPFAKLPSAANNSYKLPAGYQLIITLLNDATYNIIGANYVLIDNEGHATNHTIRFDNGPAQDLAPIVAFQVNFVGDIGGATTTLASGAGTMTYTASNLMSVLNTEPACVDWTYKTVEAANSMYSLLPNTQSDSFTQSFGLSVGGKVIHRVGEIERKLVPNFRT